MAKAVALSNAQPVPSSSNQDLTLQEALAAVSPAASASVIVGQPTENFEIQESNLEPVGRTNNADEEDIAYPTGAKVWLNVFALAIISFLQGLDLAIVAVAIPKLTDQFKTIDDIGWYSAGYGVMLSAFTFFFGKLYTLFELKPLMLIGFSIFEVGSLLCTLAPNSKAFILGRVIAGIGSSCWGNGMMAMISHCFPNEKRAMVNGILGFCQSTGLVGAPIIGGALVDSALTWRMCFGINVPLGVIAVVIGAYAIDDPYNNPDTKLPFREKLRRADFPGTLMVVPAIVLLLVYLQWGGTRYPWAAGRMIAMLVTGVSLFAGFCYIQWKQKEKASVPLRIAKSRTIIGCTVFCACTNGILAVTEYYISIYFQGVRGYSATKSGLLGIPMLVGLSISAFTSSLGLTWLGYYSPFMLATSLTAPVASGLLTTLDLDESMIRVAAYLAFLGIAVGFGVCGPPIATQTVLSPKEVSIGMSIVMFGAGLGTSVFISISSTIFRTRLVKEVERHVGSMVGNITVIDLPNVGLSDIRSFVGQDRLRDVLLGYDKAVVQSLYLPLGLACVTLVGTLITEVKSIKKKQS